MKGFSLLLCLAALAVPTAQAGTVTLTSAGGRQFTDSKGKALTAGCTIRVGTFNLPEATRDQTLSTTTDLNQLKSWFKPLAEGATGSGTAQQVAGSGNLLRTNDFPAAGEVFGTVSEINAAYMATGTKLYVWVFDASDMQQATQSGIFTASTWTAPPALGTTAISTSASVQAIQGETLTSQLRLAPVAASYSNWTWKKFGPGATGAGVGFSSDTDGDGLQNLAEYAWGLNPASRDTSPASLAANGSGATFTFKNPRALPDVEVIAECSADLKTWDPAPSTVIASDASYETRQCVAPAGSRCFYRVRFQSVTP